MRGGAQGIRLRRRHRPLASRRIRKPAALLRQQIRRVPPHPQDRGSPASTGRARSPNRIHTETGDVNASRPASPSSPHAGRFPGKIRQNAFKASCLRSLPSCHASPEPMKPCSTGSSRNLPRRHASRVGVFCVWNKTAAGISPVNGARKGCSMPPGHCFPVKTAPLHRLRSIPSSSSTCPFVVAQLVANRTAVRPASTFSHTLNDTFFSRASISSLSRMTNC